MSNCFWYFAMESKVQFSSVKQGWKFWRSLTGSMNFLIEYLFALVIRIKRVFNLTLWTINMGKKMKNCKNSFESLIVRNDFLFLHCHPMQKIFFLSTNNWILSSRSIWLWPRILMSRKFFILVDIRHTMQRMNEEKKSFRKLTPFSIRFDPIRSDPSLHSMTK